MKRLLYILVFVVAWVAYERFLVPDLPTSAAQPISAQSSPRTERWHSGQQVQGSGKVIRILADDDVQLNVSRYF